MRRSAACGAPTVGLREWIAVLGRLSSALVLIAHSLPAIAVCATQSASAQTYVRQRPAAVAQAAHATAAPSRDYDVRRQPWRGGYGSYGAGAFGYGLFGSWYVRPYPHHFDYYRVRWPPPVAVEADCPCAAWSTEAIMP